jgi:hypothetical protein
MHRVLQSIGVGSLCVAAWGASALANDSTAELSVGGLTFKTTADVSMESEELIITGETVTVRYKFLNQSPAPVTLQVAFPLPDIDLAEADNIAIPTVDPINFMGFQTKIDGRPVQFNIVQRAYLGDKDVTQAVKAAGLPLLPLAGHEEKIAALTPQVRDKLLNDGLIAQSGSNEQSQPIHSGAWLVKTAVLRQQLFPPGKVVDVEHRYKTSVGVSFDSVLRKAVRESKGMEKEFQRYRTDYCVPDDLLRSLDRMTGMADANTARLTERRVSYILKTGANWAGPIKDFRLVIDKGKADTMTAFCADNVKKLSPTAFEVRAQNFTPDRDLKILFISRRP